MRGQTSPNACTLIAMCNLYQCSADLLLDIPCDHSDSPSLSNDELAIVEHYRSCNCQWKKTIAMTAQSCANSSKRNPNVLYLPPRDSRSTALGIALGYRVAIGRYSDPIQAPYRIEEIRRDLLAPAGACAQHKRERGGVLETF